MTFLRSPVSLSVNLQGMHILFNGLTLPERLMLTLL